MRDEGLDVLRPWTRLNTSTFVVYTGKGASIFGKGLGYDVVTKLVQPFYRTFRCVVFDNLFTGMDLLRELLCNGTSQKLYRISGRC